VPSTGIVDPRSGVSGPQKGERGFDGHQRVKGIKRHVLTCSFGIILAVLVTAANVHDSHAFPTLLERSRNAGWSLSQVNVDRIHRGETVETAAARHRVTVQVVAHDPATKDFEPLPSRCRAAGGSRRPSARSPTATGA
jgi:hypothetical protein